MGNLDLIVFLVVLIVLFVIFGISTFTEFEKMSEKKFKGEEKSEGKVSIINTIGEALTDTK